MRMTIITLTTDFGLNDGYVGTLKGVILGIAPDVQLVDLSHEIAPQDIRAAAFVLSRAAPFFPDGTVHLAVIDPDVGSHRRPLAVTTQRASYVGPDNGLFTSALAETGAQAWELDRPAFWLSDVSRTFHGRDIFAPVAAHLASGVPIQRLGSPIPDPVRLEMASPARHGDGYITGQVIYVDRFGNLITDIPGEWVVGDGWHCEIAGRQIERVTMSYAAAAQGGLLALVSSAGTVEIAVRDGNAASLLGVSVGAPVTLWSID
jgi:S-adenosylmethionine hydrolase